MELRIQQARRRQRRDGCRCARQRNHAQAGGAHGIDDARAGVRYRRRAGVGNQGDALAGLQALDEAFGDFALVVLVRRDQGLVQTVAGQEMAGVAGVFAGHRIDQREQVERT